MYIGITGIPMAILLLSIESSIECHADCVTVVTMPFMLASTTMYKKLWEVHSLKVCNHITANVLFGVCSF